MPEFFAWLDGLGKDPTLKQIVDQAAHTLLGLTFLLPVILLPNPITGAISGAFYGLVREVTETSKTFSWANLKEAVSDRGSQVDVAFWALGGLLGGFFS